MKHISIIRFVLNNANLINLITAISTFIMVVFTAISIIKNAKESNRNRVLQTKILEYQIKNQWLDNVRAVCNDYVFALNFNTISNIINGIGNNEYTNMDSYNKLGEQYDNIGRINSSLLLLVNDSEFFKNNIQEQLHILYDDYNSVISDIQIIIHYMLSHNEIIQQDIIYMQNNNKLTNEMISIIKNTQMPSEEYKNHPDWMLKEYITHRSIHIQELNNNVRCLLSYFICHEKEHINELLKIN